MNSVIIPFSYSYLYLDNEDNQLNQLIEQNFGLLQTEVDPEKQKEQQYQQEDKRKEEQIDHLRTRLAQLEN